MGFDEVRFAPATEAPAIYADRFAEWLNDGGHAGMGWLERTREKRLDPSRVLPGARSMVMLGVNYWPGEEKARRQEMWAKYALYKDYHDMIEAALKRCGTLLEERFGIGPSDHRYYVDTGPVMERGFAARCGIGFQGKNGMLISRSHGNWLFLACIVTRLRFIPDPPLVGGNPVEGAGDTGQFCGTCRRCIDACPTDAIREPGLVESRLCISYQTIENKGIIPRELRPLIGGRIFGCDICLDVCPWNRFARSGRQLLLEQRYRLADLTLLEILCMTRERFSEEFRRSPVKRLKWRGLMRNGCVVAANTCGKEPSERAAILDALERLAKDDEPIVRAHAVWAIHRIAGGNARDRLKSLCQKETDPEVLEEYARAEQPRAGLNAHTGASAGNGDFAAGIRTNRRSGEPEKQ